LKYFAYVGCGILTREVVQICAELDTIIDLRFVPAGFHEQPQVLNRILQAEIDRIEEWMAIQRKSSYGRQCYQAILLGFGLCQKAVVGLHSQSLPLVIPRAHDCITLLLGSQEGYQTCFSQNPNQYWYSSGWIERMLPPGPEREKHLCQHYLEKFGSENAEFLMNEEKKWQDKYQLATFIDTKLAYSSYYRKLTQDAASSLNWDFQELQGNLQLIRDLLAGIWDEKRFAVVQPGAVINASYDDQIITAGTS
jgi:hypothetical protein